ncbi:MAG: protein-glutamate O-methyltransferase CheR [Candidatus Omnitrophota bacterium]
MKDGTLSPQEEIILRKILDGILTERGVDFRGYRSKCLWRRVVAAMHDININDAGEYLGALKKDPKAYDKLLNKITINVSEFFRNPETFFAVRDKVIPELIRRKRLKGSKVIKIWSAGCATGEEPYSIAILLKEIFKGENASFQANIYATDIDEEALQKARAGRYKRTALRELSSEQIEKNFIKESEEYYSISPELKTNIKFVYHNMIAEPKFNKIDLIFCRNVIIYFNKSLQRQVYENFHKILAEDGYIVAGKVEALMGIGEDLFERVSLSERIFKKKV